MAERFIRTLENKIYKHLTSVSINVYIDVLPAIIEKYRTIKMQPIEVTDGSVDYTKDKNKMLPKFKVGFKFKSKFN